VNVLDDEVAPCLVLRNEAAQYSLWPLGVDVPVGWLTVFGPDDREACLAHVEQQWTALSGPGSPR
jgi:MbtH protein